MFFHFETNSIFKRYFLAKELSWISDFHNERVLWIFSLIENKVCFKANWLVGKLTWKFSSWQLSNIITFNCWEEINIVSYYSITEWKICSNYCNWPIGPFSSWQKRLEGLLHSAANGSVVVTFLNTCHQCNISIGMRIDLYHTKFLKTANLIGNIRWSTL
jgi:hypothetical protein